MTSINRLQKESTVGKLTEEIKSAKSVTLIDFAGLNIVGQQDLKKRLKAATSKMIVAKNTLIKLALTEAKLPEKLTDDAILSGQTAVILGNADPVSPISAIGKFAGENEFLKFKAGFLDGEFYDKDGMLMISKLPSKEVLNGQVVGNIAGGMYSLISNLENKIQELMYILGSR